MKLTETALMLMIWDALIATGRVLLWRNNVGAANARGRHVSFGLGRGSPDLVGMLKHPCSRCSAMPGRTLECVPGKDHDHRAQFFAVEVKLPGNEPEPAQLAWHRAARDAGAIVIVAHSIEEALAGLPT